MQPHAPSTESQQDDRPDGRDLPVLALPPAPFTRSGGEQRSSAVPAAPISVVPGQPTVDTPVAASALREPMPSGTSVQDLLGALAIDGLDPIESESFLHDAAPVQERPLHEFTVAVDRRTRRERRHEQRTTPDRRAFTSEHLAAPVDGPTDPRPTMPPMHPAVSRPAPIDPVMPPLPLDEHLQPARPYQLPNRGVSAATQRSTRASLAMGELPFPQQAIDNPPPPTAAPEPPVAAPDHAPVPGTSPAGIDAIFGPPAAQPVGRLEAHAPMPPAPPAPPPVLVPDAGPAGPATAPGAGLDPVAASVAAVPSAWFGESVHVDDAMLVWNAPGTTAPLAPSVASLISPAPPVASGIAPASPATAAVATTPLSPGAAATSTRRRPMSPLRLVLLVGIPAGAGIGIAFALERFLF